MASTVFGVLFIILLLFIVGQVFWKPLAILFKIGLRLILGRVGRIVYGAPDPKAGAAGSSVDLLGETCFNHRVEVTGGVLEEKCAYAVQEFFRRLRNKDTDKTLEEEEAEKGCYAGSE
jgi:hypothetical protein